MKRLLSITGLTFALATSALSGAACVATVGAEAPAGWVVYGSYVDPVRTVPSGIYSYPRVIYRGRYAYYADNRWYYDSPRGWVVFRQEPSELARYRVSLRSRPTEERRYRTPAPQSPRYRYDRGIFEGPNNYMP